MAATQTRWEFAQQWAFSSFQLRIERRMQEEFCSYLIRMDCPEWEPSIFFRYLEVDSFLLAGNEE